MPKSAKQKEKLLYVAQYLSEYTDENYPATMADILEYLAANDIRAERKSIYNDLDVLMGFGMDIVKLAPPHSGYYLAGRNFELAEVKLLVDLVQSSKFITTKKSRELIGKLEKQVSRNDARTLQRQVVVADRNKTSNENIYYSVDMIYEALAKNVMIRYQYFDWDENKKQRLRREGACYQVSPWLLTWEDENYYLVAYDHNANMMKHYRVDKMLRIELTDQQRQGKEVFERIDIPAFSKKTFGMFAGEEKTVRMEFDRKLTGVVVDRFGADISMRGLDEKHVLVRANVAVSRQFFGWLAGLGTQVRLVSPEDVVRQYHRYLQQIADLYRESEEGRKNG